jgi:hypothetical protein
MARWRRWRLLRLLGHLLPAGVTPVADRGNRCLQDLVHLLMADGPQFVVIAAGGDAESRSLYPPRVTVRNEAGGGFHGSGFTRQRRNGLSLAPSRETRNDGCRCGSPIVSAASKSSETGTV